MTVGENLNRVFSDFGKQEFSEFSKENSDTLLGKYPHISSVCDDEITASLCRIILKEAERLEKAKDNNYMKNMIILAYALEEKNKIYLLSGNAKIGDKLDIKILNQLIVRCKDYLASIFNDWEEMSSDTSNKIIENKKRFYEECEIHNPILNTKKKATVFEHRYLSSIDTFFRLLMKEKMDSTVSSVFKEKESKVKKLQIICSKKDMKKALNLFDGILSKTDNLVQLCIQNIRTHNKYDQDTIKFLPTELREQLFY